MKEMLKTWAKKIRYLKSIRKKDKRGSLDIDDIAWDIRNLKYEFRHHHIAACEMRGTPRSRIETPRDNNKPSQRYIDLIKEKFGEIVRTGTA